MQRVGTTAPVGIVLVLATSFAAGQSLKDLDPTNKDSSVRRGARHFEEKAREAGRHIDKKVRSFLSEPEKKLSEGAYYAYKKFVEGKQTRVRAFNIQAGSFYHKLIHPFFSGKIDVTKATFYFDAFVPADMAAVTFGAKVYVRGPLKRNDANTAVLLAHELTHVLQYKRLGGEKEFAHRYFGQIARAARERALRGNFDFALIHGDLELENEARAVENAVAEFYRTGRMPPALSARPLLRGNGVGSTINSVYEVDYNCTARAVAVSGSTFYWVDHGAKNLYHGRIGPQGWLVASGVVDSDCSARLVAASGNFLYWLDSGSKSLYRGRLVSGRLSNPVVIDPNCAARTMTASGDYLYWVDKGSKDLFRGRIANNRIIDPVVIDPNCTARVLAASGDHLYWVDQGSKDLYRGRVVGNRITSPVVIDPRCEAKVLTAAGQHVYWRD